MLCRLTIPCLSLPLLLAVCCLTASLPRSLCRRRTRAGVRGRLTRNISDIHKLRAVFAARGAAFVPPLATARKLLTSFNFCYRPGTDDATLAGMAALLQLNADAGVNASTGLFAALQQQWGAWLPALRPFLRACAARVTVVGASGPGAGGAPTHPVLDLLVALTDADRWSGADARPTALVARRVAALLLTDCALLRGLRGELVAQRIPTPDAPTPAMRATANGDALRWVLRVCATSPSPETFYAVFVAEILTVPVVVKAVDDACRATLVKPDLFPMLLRCFEAARCGVINTHAHAHLAITHTCGHASTRMCVSVHVST